MFFVYSSFDWTTIHGNFDGCGVSTYPSSDIREKVKRFYQFIYLKVDLSSSGIDYYDQLGRKMIIPTSIL